MAKNTLTTAFDQTEEALKHPHFGSRLQRPDLSYDL